MPAKCSYYKCKNSLKNRATGFRFFKFPKESSHQWVINCGKFIFTSTCKFKNCPNSIKCCILFAIPKTY